MSRLRTKRLENIWKSFTIRAAAIAKVILTGEIITRDVIIKQLEAWMPHTTALFILGIFTAIVVTGGMTGVVKGKLDSYDKPPLEDR